METVQVCKLTMREAIHFDLTLATAFVVKFGDCDVKKKKRRWLGGLCIEIDCVTMRRLQVMWPLLFCCCCCFHRLVGSLHVMLLFVVIHMHYMVSACHIVM